jgi:hypothetical protein
MKANPERLVEATASSSDAARFWHDQIRLAQKVEEKWREQAVKIVERTRLNIFHANYPEPLF